MKQKSPFLVLLMVGLFLQGGLDLFAQTMRGVVTEAETGEPIFGATVALKGTTIGTVTDADGNYEIKDIEPGRYNVESKFVGYDPMEVQEVLIAGKKEVVVNFSLKESNNMLGEVEIRPTVSKEMSINRMALVGAHVCSAWRKPAVMPVDTAIQPVWSHRLLVWQVLLTTTVFRCMVMLHRVSHGVWRVLKSTAQTTLPMPLQWVQV